MPDTYVAAGGGELLVLQIGNGATPEVFAASCTINTTRSIDMSGSASTTELADCTNPSAPAQMVREIKSVDLKFSGAGIADLPSVLALIQWMSSGAQKNCKIIQNASGAAGGFTIAVPLVITALQLAGARGDKQTFTATLEQAAPPTSITANP